MAVAILVASFLSLSASKRYNCTSDILFVRGDVVEKFRDDCPPCAGTMEADSAPSVGFRCRKDFAARHPQKNSSSTAVVGRCQYDSIYNFYSEAIPESASPFGQTLPRLQKPTYVRISSSLSSAAAEVHIRHPNTKSRGFVFSLWLIIEFLSGS